MSITVTPTYPADQPMFDGQPVFGTGAVTVTELGPQPPATAAAIDAFLGLAAGTTKYGAGSGRLWGIKGSLVGSSPGAVGALEATLLSFAGRTAKLGIPTVQTYPSDYWFRPNCYFTSGDYAPSSAGIVAIGGGQYSLSYAIVVREAH
jgi:hypothetical protein